jgi:hypothetical protein
MSQAMLFLMMVVFLSSVASCGMYPHRTANSDSGQQTSTPATGNGGGGAY